MSDDKKHPLEYLSEVQDMIDLHEYLGEDSVAEAIDLALKCIAKPNVPPAEARKALILFQAFALKFEMQGYVYMQIRPGKTGSIENAKKNVYFKLSKQCHEMAQTLKYLSKEQY